MLNRIVAWLALAVSIGAWAWNLARPAPRFAYAETGIIMAEFTEAIKAKNRFEEHRKEWEANLKTLNDSLTATMELMKREYDKSPAPRKDSLRALLQKRNDDLQRYSNAVKQLSVEKEKELMDPVIKKVNSFLDLWGKEHRYDMIFGTMTGGNILQAGSDLNVTSRVIRDMNEQYRDLSEAGEAKPAVGALGLEAGNDKSTGGNAPAEEGGAKP